MKKEARGKKGLVLGLVIGLVVLLLAAAAAAVVFLFILPGQQQTAVEEGAVKLYWNVDREANTDPDTGLSIRKPADDGVYYVRFAHNGAQVEVPVADKKLVNYIDSLDLMGLVLDANGYAVDVKPLTDVVSIIGESLYVQSVNGDTLIANSSIMMNGRKITVKLTDEVGIYNVSGKGEFVGEPFKATDLNPMDTISIYGTWLPEDSEEDPVVTDIFVLKKPAESKIYWRADQFYDSTNKVTTRVPDENGAYTIPFWVDGEYVELKSKDIEVVTFIDAPAYYWCHYGLEFDEEGYIIDAFDSFLGARNLLQCERYDITEIDEEGNYVATSLIKNNGAFVQGTVGEDCPIWEVSKASAAEGEPCRKIDSLKLGDRVCIWTDTLGNPVLIYVAHRLVDSPAYWNVTRSWDSTNQMTSRTPNSKGIYEIELLPEGGVKTMYYTDDVKIASAIDQTADYCVGLKVGAGNKIEAVYDMECIFGYTYFVRGYYITEASSTVCSFLSPSGSGYAKNGVLTADCVAYDVSLAANVYGEKTKLRIGDLVYSCKTPTGEIASAYITRRYLGEEHLYWNLYRKYDSTNKVTTRVPEVDENGVEWYIFELCQNGKIITAKTNDKAIATTIDSYSAPGLYINVGKDGVITGPILDGNYAAGGTKWASREVVAVDGYEVTIRSSSGSETTFSMDDDTKVVNVSTAFSDHKGELTKLRVGDYVNVYRDIYSNVLSIYVRTRQTDHMAWPVSQQYDSATASTKRVPVADENGVEWYYIDLAINGKVSTYKTSSKEMADNVDSYSTAFGISLNGDVITGASSSTYVKNVKGAGVTNYVVSSVSGKNVNLIYTLGHADKTGTTETITMGSNCKIIDVSGNAEVFGGYVKLQTGDTIRTYVAEEPEGETLYIYVLSHNTRAGGYYSYCDHCNKKVYWNAYTSSSSIPAYNTHFYLPYDVEKVGSQLGVYSTANNFEIVLDLNGHTLYRDGGRLALVRYGDTLTIFDSSEVKDADGNIVQPGTGKMVTKNSTANGGVIMISSGTTGADGKPTGVGVVNIYSGTLTVLESDNAWSYSAQGGIITSSGTLNIYGGTLEGGRVVSKTDTGSKGGVINSSGTLNIYDGLITGGQANGFYTNEAGEEIRYQANGGNIMSSGTTNIYGGVISNGTAGRGGNIYVDAGVLNFYDGEILGGAATVNFGRTTDGRGGNICNTGEVHLMGGLVADGTTDKGYGGNLMTTGMSDFIEITGDVVVSGGVNLGSSRTSNSIYAMYSNLIISGGTIKNDEFAAGAYIGSTGTNTGGFTTITVTGGVIEGNINGSGGLVNILKDEEGKEYYLSSDVKYYIGYNEDGSAYYITASGKQAALYPDYRTKFVLSGGTIGKVAATNPHGDEIAVSGKVVIKDLALGGSALVNVGNLTAGANIAINGTGIFTKPLTNASNYTQFFSTSMSGFVVGVTEAGELKVYNPDAISLYCEHCGAEADWMPWDGVSTSGHYFLTGDVQLTDVVVVSGDMILDLRGFTVTAAENVKAFEVAGNFSVMDTSDAKTGMITGGSAYRGGNIYVNSTASFTLYSGIIANGTAVNALGTGTTGGRGGNIFSAGGDVTLKGGIVTGGRTSGGSDWGGNIMMTGGLLTIENGVIISNGTAASGGNVYLMYADMVMTGGEIKEGTANNGNCVYLRGSGNFSSLVITGGIIDGQVYNYEAESTVTVGGTAQITKLTLKGLLNVQELSEGASIGIDVTGIFTAAFETKEAAEAAAAYFVGMNDTQIIAVTDANELTIKVVLPDVKTESFYCEHCKQNVDFMAWNGSAISASGHYYIEGDLQLTDMISIAKGLDVVINLNGYTITAAENTRIFYVGGSLSIMDSSEAKTGKITDGRATRGGNIYLSETVSVLNLYSGTIANGVADNALGTSTTNGRGGNIFGYGTINLYGGTITGGTTEGGNSWGGNIFKMSGTLNIFDGAVISNGTAKCGANVYTMYATVNMTGGSILGGTVTDSGTGIYLNGTSTGGFSTLNISGGTIGKSVYSGYAENTINISGNPVIGALKHAGIVNIGEMAEGAAIAMNPKLPDNSVFTDVVANGEALLAYFTAYPDGYKVVVNADGKLEVVVDENATPTPDPEPEPEPDPTPDPEPEPSETVFCPHCEQEVAFTELALSTIVVDGKDLLTVDGGHYYLAQDLVLSAKVYIKTAVDVVIDLRGCDIDASAATHAFDIRNGAVLSICDTAGDDVEDGVIFGANNPEGSGGNIYAYNGATFNLYGGVITGGSALKRGGNIYMTSATCNLYGGSVIGGTITEANNEGANVYVMQGNLNILGDVTIVNENDGIGECVYVWGTSTTASTFKMTDGVIEGELFLGGVISAAELSGTAVVAEVTLNKETKLTKVGEFAEGADVKFAAVAGTLTTGATIAEADLAYVDAMAMDKILVINADGQLEVAEGCACGCKAPVADVVWTDAHEFFQALSQLETDNGVIAEDVHLKLSADLDITAIYGAAKQISMGGSDDVAVNVVIDLNGYTWSSQNRIYNYPLCTLTIMDSSEAQTGTMSSTGRSSSAHGGIVANYGTLNVLGGTFTQPENGSVNHKGGLIYQSKGVTNIYGGTFTGGQANDKGSTLGMGGGIHIYSGTLNIYGGTITGNIGNQGADIYMRGGTNLNVYGGVIGEVFCEKETVVPTVSGTANIAKLILNGSLLNVGKLEEGAAIVVDVEGVFTNAVENAEEAAKYFSGTIEGTMIDVDAEGKLTVIFATACPCGCGAKADEVVWIDPTEYFTANNNGDVQDIYLPADAHVKLTQNFDAAALFGRIKQVRVGKTAEPAKVVIDLNGYTWTGNHRIYINEGSELTIMDSSAEGTGLMAATGKDANSGGTIANYGTFNLMSGTLSMIEKDGITIGAGGVVYQSKGVFNLYGGTITGGKATNGGAVYIRIGEFNMFGGEIKDGVANTNGANLYLGATAVFNKTAGTIADEANTVYQAQ